MSSSEPLGILTKYVSTRKRKYALQDVAARILPGERVSWCSRHARASVVEIRKAGESVFYSGLATCGSIWLCPVCSSRIRAARRAELERAASSGYFMVMVSVTLQHSRQDELESLLSALSLAWRKMRAGRKWQEIAEKYKLAASCSALEVTYSEKAGFHPHKHALFFSALPESLFNIESFQAELSERWQAALAKLGEYASEHYGLKVTRGAAGYLQKWSASDELTSESKAPDDDEHYTMWQVLELAGQSAHFRKVFQEYAAATKSKRALFWSAGARELLGLAEEKPDEEIAAEEPEESQVVAVLSREEWRLVCKHSLRGELLEVAANTGAVGVFFVLERLRWQEKEVVLDG